MLMSLEIHRKDKIENHAFGPINDLKISMEPKMFIADLGFKMYHMRDHT